MSSWLSLLLSLLLLSSGGWALPPAPLMPTKPTEDTDLLADLQDGRDSEQVFAARELRRQVRLAIRQLYARDEVLVLEARQTLAQFDETLAPICMEILTRPNLTVPCADILGDLGTRAALPLLQDTLDATTARGPRRHLSAAIHALQDGPSGEETSP